MHKIWDSTLDFLPDTPFSCILAPRPRPCMARADKTVIARTNNKPTVSAPMWRPMENGDI